MTNEMDAIMENVKRELDYKRQAEELEQLRREIEILKQNQTVKQEPVEAEANIFLETYVDSISSEHDRKRLKAGEAVSYYEADISYLNKAWAMYKANDKAWEREKGHVANTLGMLPLQLKFMLMEHEGKVKL